MHIETLMLGSEQKQSALVRKQPQFQKIKTVS